jgi:CheY-like chemotaxis protein
MDDEEVVRDVAAQMLLELGYEVLLAPDGAVAIECYRSALAAGRPVDVVLLDLTIPGGMGGGETVAKLRELDPDVKAIVSSGYSHDPILADYRAYGFQGMIAQPYTIVTMSTVLRSLLEDPRQPPPP